MSENPPPYSAPPPEQPYQQEAYGRPPAKVGSGLAIAALVVGILAILLSWTLVGGIVLGIIALVLGLVASSKAKKGTGGGRGMAITGIVLGVIGALISIGIIVAGALFLDSGTGKDLRDCLQKAGNNASAQQQCQNDFSNKLTN